MKHLVIALHDVAPSTLDETARWRDIVAGLTEGPVSLLLVPRYHGRESWRAGPAPAWIRARVIAGDEPVLHGYSHLSPSGRDGRELAGRDPVSIDATIRDGVREMRGAGLPTEGFIAPSYAHPGAADASCAAAGLRWWATRTSLRSASDAVKLPSLGLGASTPARRALSPAAGAAAVRALGAAPVLRLDLHPSDLCHARLERAGRHLLERLLLQNRQPLTHAALLDRPHPLSTRAPRG